MSNMSYCRFQNTLADLRDCHEAMGDEEGELSIAEQRARYSLLRLCFRIAGECCDDDGEPNWPNPPRWEKA